jgi:1,4-dihydroxy-2-naphthoate octaprenyltransferase
MGCFFLYTQNLGSYVVLPAVTIGLLSAAVLNLNNMRDRISDAKSGKNTLAVVLGPNKVKVYHATLIVTAFIAAALFIWIGLGGGMHFVALIAFLPLFLNMVKVFRTADATTLDPELKKVALSTFLFALLLFASNFF